MARVGTSAAIALLVLFALAASAAFGSLVETAVPGDENATVIPRCCQDFHAWAEEVGCPPNLDGQCNAWCQNRCSGGACKIMGGKHYCHCNCR